MTIIGISLFLAALMAPEGDIAKSPASLPAAVQSACKPGRRHLRFRTEWISNSHAICPFDYVEFNRRVAAVIELPEGGYSPEYFSGLFGPQAMVQRPEWQPNGFYSTQSAWLLVLAAEKEDANDWNSALTLYIWKWGVAGKSRTRIQFDILPQGRMDQPASSGCLTQAELMDRATAAGWEYATREWIVEFGPDRKEGLLIHKDGRSLTLQGLSGPDGLLPPRAQLEAKCAEILKFSAESEASI